MGAVELEAGTTGCLPRRREPAGDAVAGTEVHLVGRLALEGRVGEPFERAVVWATAGMESAEPGAEQVVLGRHPLEALAQDGDLRGERASAGEPDERARLGLRDPAADEQEGREHRPRVGGPAAGAGAGPASVRGATLPDPERRGHGVPEISRFFGISIMMRSRDHRPPHFHVCYGGQRATVTIRSPHALEGDLSPRVRRLVLEWAAAHEVELLADWERIENGATPLPIPPLE